MPTDKDLPSMSVADVAEEMRVSRSHVWKQISDKKLRAYKMGRVVRLRRSDVEAALLPAVVD